MAYEPIIFESKNNEALLDRAAITSPISSVDQTRTGTWDVTKAGFDISFSEERMFSFTNQLNNNGITGGDQRNTLTTLYSITGDERFKPNQTAMSGGTGQLLGLVEDDYNNRGQLFESFYDDDDLVAQYDAYVLANPELGLKTIGNVKISIQEQHDQRQKNLSNALSRNPSDFSNFMGNLAGGFGAILDPTLLPGLFSPIGGGRLAYKIGSIAVVTFLEETLIQHDVARFKGLLGEEWNVWNNVFLASGFAATLPLLGTAIGKLIRGGKPAYNAGKSPGGMSWESVKKINQALEEAKTAKQDYKIADAYEADRAGKLLEGYGAVSGVKAHIHKPGEVILTGVSKKFSKGMGVGKAKQVVSTLRARIGAKNTNKILKQADSLGRRYDSISLDEMSLLRGQAATGLKPNLDAATKAVSNINELKRKSNQNQPIPPTKETQGLKRYKADDYDTNDQMWETESKASQADANSPVKTNRQEFDEIIEAEKALERFRKCNLGG